MIAALLATAALTSCVDSCAGSRVERARAEAAEPRDVAPAFSLPVLGRETAISLESLRGKTVIIDFWATWCVPCEFQVPELNAFYEAHRSDSDVALLGISVDTAGPEAVAQWVAEQGVRYPILLADDELAMQYGAQGFPTVVVVRGDGTVDMRHSGVIQTAELEEILAGLRDPG